MADNISNIQNEESGHSVRVKLNQVIQQIKNISQELDSTISEEDLQELVRWINTQNVPETVGGFKGGEQATSASGLSFQEVMNKLLFPAINPEVSMSVSPAPEFKHPSFNNTITWDINIITAGATLASLSFEFRRGNTGSWTELTSNVEATSYTHEITGNETNETWNYRLTVIDSSGAETVSYINRTMKSYTAPSINWTLSSSAGSHYETGESVTVNASISRTSPFVNITGYQLYQQTNGGSWASIGDFESLSAAGGAIQQYIYGNGSSVNSTRFRVAVTDSEGSTNHESQTISFRNASYFGISTTPPGSLSSSTFGDLNKLLLTGKEYSVTGVTAEQGEYTWYIYPADRPLIQTINMGVTPIYSGGEGAFSIETEDFNYENDYGVNIIYRAYVSNADAAFGNDPLEFI